ncbi:hypothetical protein [Geodermatophilus sp. SYSU D00815]
MRFAGDDTVAVVDDGRAVRLDAASSVVPPFTRELVGEDVDVREIRTVERSLEEIFFAMTGRCAMTALTGSTRAELLRLYRWPSLWAPMGAWLTLNLTFGCLFDYIAYRTGDDTAVPGGIPAGQLVDGLLPPTAPVTLVHGMPLFDGALVMIMGALVVGSGYGWGTGKTVLTRGPGGGRRSAARWSRCRCSSPAWCWSRRRSTAASRR